MPLADDYVLVTDVPTHPASLSELVSRYKAEGWQTVGGVEDVELLDTKTGERGVYPAQGMKRPKTEGN